MRSDFTMREVTFNEGNLTVVRTRTSNGYAAITIKVVNDSITFINVNDNHEYEQQAAKLADLIDEAAGTPCSLPEVEHE